MQDIIEAIKARLNSPLLGYFLLSILAWNLSAFFYLLVQDNEVLGRIQYFQSHTSIYSLVTWPLTTSFLLALIYPWVIFVIAFLTSKPNELKETIQANFEHKLLIERKKLEEARARLLASAESELIERAKRDQELDELQSDELKSKLRVELEQLRAERDSFKNKNRNLIEEHKQLMDISEMYRNRAKQTNDFIDSNKLIKQAQEIEEKAAKLLMQLAD